MGRSKGFSVVELLCALGMALIVSQIAIPSLQQNRIAANEAAAIASLRDLHAGGPSPMRMPTGPEEKSGYRFSLSSSGLSSTNYYVVAVPVSPNKSGVRSYCVSSDAVVHVDSTGGTPASESNCRALPAVE